MKKSKSNNKTVSENFLFQLIFLSDQIFILFILDDLGTCFLETKSVIVRNNLNNKLEV